MSDASPDPARPPQAPRPLRILLTGGAGYVGSHALVELLAAGHRVHVLDSFVTSGEDALARVRALAGRDFGATRADIRDAATVAAVVADFDPEAVIHCAGLKSLPESVTDPLAYYAANVGGTLTLLAALQGSACRRFVFSSSAAVYGTPDYLPVDEAHPLRPESPYGRTKVQIETVLADLAAADPAWSVALLRYFNPAGAHPSGRIGETPRGAPDTIVTRLAEVAAGRLSGLTVHGDDYPTPDGTGIRDFIHVADLARAHLAAVDWTGQARGCRAFNLGGGHGTSVLELVGAFRAASGREIPLAFGPRRPGDVAASFADPARAAAELGWRSAFGLEEICRSAWAWTASDGVTAGAADGA